jgi:adenylate kinase family enzyme
MHPLVFLVGLHGSGKSTAGRQLAQYHGWHHISLGDLGRLARKGRRPNDVSLRLMVCMATFRPGTPLPEVTIQAIVSEVTKNAHVRPVVCDGFPASAEHIRRLPAGSIVIELTCDPHVREHRLVARESQTLRKWTPGLPSLRDTALPDLAAAAANAGVRYLRVENTAEGQRSLSAVTERLLDLSSAA